MPLTGRSDCSGSDGRASGAYGRTIPVGVGPLWSAIEVAEDVAEEVAVDVPVEVTVSVALEAAKDVVALELTKDAVMVTEDVCCVGGGGSYGVPH